MKEIEQLKEMYRFVFNETSGIKVLKDLEARCNYRVSSFVKGDSNATAYEEGKRAVYLYILNMLEKAKTNE
tara:strand:+ start:1166 stop:1378 length:213 start_codon:yes stop_codon:yes gene_type:complete